MQGQIKRIKKIIDRSFNEDLLWSVIADEKNIYAFTDSDDPLYLYEFNADTLETINKTRIDIPGSVNAPMIYDGNIYFEVTVSGEENGDKLGKYNIKSKTISWIETLEEISVLSIVDMFEYKDKIYAINDGSARSEDNAIIILDPATDEQELIEFEYSVRQAEIKNDSLYITDDTTLYKYALKGNKVKLIDSKEVYTEEDNNSIYYLGSFFLNDK